MNTSLMNGFSIKLSLVHQNNKQSVVLGGLNEPTKIQKKNHVIFYVGKSIYTSNEKQASQQ